jgi:hypothetical protein
LDLHFFYGQALGAIFHVFLAIWISSLEKLLFICPLFIGSLLWGAI